MAFHFRFSSRRDDKQSANDVGLYRLLRFAVVVLVHLGTRLADSAPAQTRALIFPFAFAIILTKLVV